MQIAQGIQQFKCATIAEAEMAAMAGAGYILIAHQLPEPKIRRLLQLISKYPKTKFASLVDNEISAVLLNELFSEENKTAIVWLDVDDGMHRSGHAADDPLINLYQYILQLPHVYCEGLHVYDGHIHDTDFAVRQQRVETDFKSVKIILQKITALKLPSLKVVAGGTPSFTIHALHHHRYCSPGTCLLWDFGYGNMLKEQHFQQAAILLTRIISKPMPGRMTTDLGHKAVAAENPLNKRIIFLNLTDYEIAGQSEEHLVIEVPESVWQQHQVGDVLYGIPYHICPTVALYEEAQVIKDGEQIDTWQIMARKRKISV
jgi:3-hydroxy-D-aspartate aldolase